MSAGAEITFFFKAATVGLLWFATLQLLRTPQLAARLTALCVASVACYVLCSMGIVSRWDQARWLWPLAIVIHAGCLGAPFFFWLMTRALFEDDFQLRLRHGVLLGLLLALGFFVIGRGELYQTLMQQPLFSTLRPLIPQVFSVAFVVHALVLVQLGRSGDLVESRRRARLILVLSVGVYSLLIALVEIALKGSHKAVPAVLQLVHSCGLLGVTTFALLRLNQPVVLWGTGPLAVRRPTPSGAGLKLQERFASEQLFRTEDLTVARLATLLGQPEYLLRRTINQELGFRNFNDFLNQARVEQAKAILANPDNKDLPILRLAMDLGYGSLAPFNRAFRRITGTTPSGFRRAHLPDNKV